MLKWEHKLIDQINRYMVPVSVGFVIIAAAWIRMCGRRYVGNDFHYFLYDIPGNCNSFAYRCLVDFLMLHFADSAVVLLKYLAYAGDFAVAFLVLWLVRPKRQEGNLLILTACLLSPVALIYSVSGMKIDSVCMAFLLAGILLFRRDRQIPATILFLMPGFLYPAYWPLDIGLAVGMTIRKYRAGRSARKLVAALSLTAFFLAVSVWIENSGVISSSFWGKLFVIDPDTGLEYAEFGRWLLKMCYIYGYAFSMGFLLLSLRYRKLRIPALILQVAVIMYVGWKQTSFLAL